MVRTRPSLPAGHGEVVERPSFSEWAELVRTNRERATRDGFSFAGAGSEQLRAEARRDILSVATAFSPKLGVSTRQPMHPSDPLVLTGHQPDLYHPGVWVKDFLLDRLSRETGATAIDVVVDSDGFDAVAVTSPCLQPGLARCRQYLALGTPESCFAFSPVPSDKHIADFCETSAKMLENLPAPAVHRHFAVFCDCLRAAVPDASNLAELVTIARRRYEASVSTGYLEAPLTSLSTTPSFRRLVAGLVLDAPRFAAAYNTELAEYRGITKTRSAAQPFPDLAVEGDRIELPLWILADGHRETVWAEGAAGGGARLLSAGRVVAELPSDPSQALESLTRSAALIAPKALILTLYLRLFACDLFIHGIGGGRYDQVTDGVMRRYFEVEPPAFVVASMTMYLPLGAHVVSDEEVAAAKDRLNRVEHNPDALLGEVEFDSAEQRARAVDLAAEKSVLVSDIAQPDADKKELGARIRTVLINAELALLLAPVKESFAAQLATLETQRAASEILTDRTYPFCFWDPIEIADKVW